MLCSYYSAKEVISRIRQKSYDLRKITNNALERARKKYDLQAKQLKDTGKREKYKVYGELLTTYGYELKGGEKSFTCDNYYTNEKITIPLDGNMSAVDNAKRFFEKYSKLKRTFEALNIQIEETKQEISHLESISNALDIARQEEDLSTIRRELSEYGYMKRQTGQQGKGSKKTAKASLSTIFLQTVLIYMLAKTITRMMSLHLRLQQAMTGGSMQRQVQAHTLLLKQRKRTS